MISLAFCMIILPHNHHRALHSFPTRRSSDLGPCDSVCPIVMAGEVTGNRAVGDPTPATSIQSLDVESVLERLDRKSTRLNSSHSSISYAVFCLRKRRSRSAILLHLIVRRLPT